MLPIVQHRKSHQLQHLYKLVLYHHSPGNNDGAIRAIEKDAQAVFPNTIAAREGLEIRLPA